MAVDNKVRVARRPRPAGSKLSLALSPGDTIEYSMTAEIKSARSGNWWLKVGGSTSIRDGESPDIAKKRLTDFVHSMMDERAQAIIK